MTTVDQFLKALAMVESSDNPEAWGDAGRAMGRWQVHPDRLVFEAGRQGKWPMVGTTWDQWVAVLLHGLWKMYYPGNSPTEIAMLWHVGHWVGDGDHGWDAQYAARFDAALLKAQEELGG